jgi:hypothetical protein
MSQLDNSAVYQAEEEDGAPLNESRKPQGQVKPLQIDVHDLEIDEEPEER